MEKRKEHINISEAKQNFSQLIKRVEQGEEIIIDRRNKPVAKLSPENEPTEERPLGTGKDFVVEMDDDFNEPLPDDLLNEFYK